MKAAQRRAGQALKIKPLCRGGWGKSQDLFAGRAAETRRVMKHNLQKNMNVNLSFLPKVSEGML